MINKTKISIIALALGAFIAGGFAFNAYQAGAFGEFSRFGFFGGGCDLSGIEKDSPEWQAKIEECKAEREAKVEEFKTMTPEERQAKMEEFRADCPQDGERIRLRQSFGGHAGRGMMFGPMLESVNHQVENLSNGVRITITSDDSDIVQKLQDAAARIK